MLSENAKIILSDRYLQEGETPEQLWERVARAVAEAEPEGRQREKWAAEFYDMMNDLKFLPNSPAIRNAGTEQGCLSACFSPDQPIETISGMKPISDIKMGEMVLTHTGRYLPVTEVMNRNSAEIISIDIAKLPKNTLKVTGEHPILTDEGWKLAKTLCPGDYVVITHNKIVEDKTSVSIADSLGLSVDGEWAVCQNSTRWGKKKRRPFDLHHNHLRAEIPVDEKLLWFLGMYLANGSAHQTTGDIRIVFNKKDLCFAERAHDYLTYLGLPARTFLQEDKKRGNSWLTVRAHSTYLSSLLYGWCGKGFAGKQLQHWLMCLPPEKQRHILRGVYDGDGSSGQNLKKITLSNRRLVAQLFEVALRLGKVPSFRQESMPRLGKHLPWSIVYGQTTERFVKRLPDGTVAYRIRDVRIEEHSGKVYNFEVPNDHTYAANFVAVHNCFVISPDDNMESIMQIAHDEALILKWGGGIGFGFSKLRPKGDSIKTTHKNACGPIAVMKLYSKVSETITQGSFRNGALMAQLDVSHPDIFEFIHVKDNDNTLKNFNISVQVTEKFIAAVENNGPWHLINPRNGETSRTVDACVLWQELIGSAHKTGDPGIVFIDRIRSLDPNPQFGGIWSSNPCGEVYCSDYESCNLASIDLAKFITNNHFDYDAFDRIIYKSIRFLDDVVSVNKFPLPKLTEMNARGRRIGLGVMGWADLLLRLGVPYDSNEALGLATKIGSILNDTAWSASGDLAKERGPFPDWEQSALRKKIGEHPMRNCSVTLVAPTGTISRLADTSSGIEPHFALAWHSNVLWKDHEGTSTHLIDAPRPIIEALSNLSGAGQSVLRDIADYPERGRQILAQYGVNPTALRTSHEISPIWHVKMQSIWQQFVSDSISKTINLSHSATVQDIEQAYLNAWATGCKCVTVYRDGSKSMQVLETGATKREEKKQEVITVRELPDRLTGERIRIKTGLGSMYVSINRDEAGNPVEVFANIGKAGGVIPSFAEAIGRLISMALRAGVSVADIVKQLSGISCTEVVWHNGELVLSVPDGIAKALALAGDHAKSLPQSPPIPLSTNLITAPCPECGSQLVFSDGCRGGSCPACAFSKCS